MWNWKNKEFSKIKIKVILEPESIPEWNTVGRKDYDFEEHWGGNYINFYTSIKPKETEDATSIFVVECCQIIARWILLNRNKFSNTDRFQIGIGGLKDSEFLGRQIVKTGGTWEDIDKLADGNLVMKFYPDWSNNVFGVE